MPKRERADAMAKGRLGERKVMKRLQAAGCLVVPTADYTGPHGDRAPLAKGHGWAVVIPDLDVSKGGHRAWCEVKWKLEPSYCRTLQRYEHGIDLTNYREYLKMQKASGTPVVLAIVESATDTILYQSLQALGAPKVYTGRNNYGKGGMVYWARDAFKVLDDAAPEAFLTAAMAPRVVTAPVPAPKLKTARARAVPVQPSLF
jgi:hypothetical protein